MAPQRPRRSRPGLPIPRLRRRWFDRVGLAATLIAVAGVVVVNWVILDRTERFRRTILSQSDAIRAQSDSLSLSIARGAINLQAFLLTGDSTHLDDYRSARESADSLMGRLEISARTFGAVTQRTYGTVDLLREEWHAGHDELLAERRPDEAALDQVDDERTRVLDLLAVLSDLNGVAQLQSAERRASILRIYRVGGVATAVLALLAGISVVYAYVYRQRLAARNRQAQTRARQLERALRGREEILGIVSHDLRNSLNVVVAAIDLARTDGLPEEVRTHQLAVAARTSRGMTRLIGDLLDAESLDAGSLGVERRAADPARIVAEAADAWEQEARNRGVTLRRTVGEGTGAVEVDPDRILQVLGNLIGNAIKFTPESGLVTVSAAPVEGMVRFQVEDTGPGIPSEHLHRIFDRFYQVRSSGKAGAGLGLAIAQGIVNAHDSSLEVTTWPGEGSRFWFDIPALGTAAADSPAPVAPGTKQAGVTAPPATPDS